MLPPCMALSGPETTSAHLPCRELCGSHRPSVFPLDIVQSHVGRKGKRTPLLVSLAVARNCGALVTRNEATPPEVEIITQLLLILAV